MEVKYFFDGSTGKFIGTFDPGPVEDAEAWFRAYVPEGAIEWPTPPNHGKDRLNLQTMEIIPYEEPVTLLERLTAIFNALTVETQAAFGPLAAAVFMFLTQGNPAAAKLVIQSAPIPPEFEPVRTQMLAVFQS